MFEASRRAKGRGRIGEKGLGIVTATIVLAAVVAGTGAVGFVVLDALGGSHSTTTSVHQCSPPTLPQCSDPPKTAGTVAHVGALEGDIVR